MNKVFIKANSFGPNAGSRANNLCFPARPPVQVSAAVKSLKGIFQDGGRG